MDFDSKRRLGFNLGVNNQSENTRRLKETGKKYFATFLNESGSQGLKIRNATLKQQITKQMLNCCITPGLYMTKRWEIIIRNNQMTGSWTELAKKLNYWVNDVSLLLWTLFHNQQIQYNSWDSCVKQHIFKIELIKLLILMVKKNSNQKTPHWLK